MDEKCIMSILQATFFFKNLLKKFLQLLLRLMKTFNEMSNLTIKNMILVLFESLLIIFFSYMKLYDKHFFREKKISKINRYFACAILNEFNRGF